jgi:hemolysin III
MVRQIKDGVAQIGHDVAGAVEQLVTRPLLRGVSHLVAFVLSIGTGVVLMLQSTAAVQWVASSVFGAGLTLALGTSALYHRVRWSERAHRILRGMDHSMIFVLVASTYTPILLLSLHGGWRVWSMVAVWVIATAGIIVRLTVRNLPRAVLVATYLGIGWTAVLLLPKLAYTLTGPSLVLLIVGGLLYTVGGVVFLLRRPDPVPRVFGFHEVFHAFVIAAASCHYAAVWPLVARRIAA